MNRYLNWSFVALVSCLVVVFFSGNAHAVSLKFEASSPEVDLGNILELDIVVSDLGDISLSAFTLDVVFDDELFDFNDYTLSSDLGELFENGGHIVDWSFGYYMDGRIGFDVFSLFDVFNIQSGEITLATLSLEGTASGDGFLTFDNVLLGDESGIDILESNKDLSIVVENQIVAVNAPAAVPEPGTIFLFSAGLFGLLPFRKRMID